MHTSHKNLLFVFLNLLLCSVLQQIVFVTFAIRQIDARDSKISPELKTYSKFEDELRAIRNSPRTSSSSSKNPIDSAGSNGVNKFLSKESDSEEVESIDEDELQSTTSSVRLELNKDDNQSVVVGTPDEVKSAKETTNSNSISNSTSNNTSDNGKRKSILIDFHSDHTHSSSDADSSNNNSSNRDRFNETTTASSNDVKEQLNSSIDSISSTTTDQSASVSTSGSFDQTTEAALFEQVGDHLSQSTEAPNNATSMPPLDHTNSSSQASDNNSTVESANSETSTTPNFVETTDSNNANLTDNKPNDSSSFTHRPCFMLDELESMNCSSCLRCTVIFSAKNKSLHFEPFKVFLVFSNETFSILDFLSFETKFRNEFELKIQSKLNISHATIIYEDPFPIVNPNQTVLSILVANKTFERFWLSENDLKDSLVNASLIRSLFNESRWEIEKSFAMRLDCVDTGLIKRCAFPLTKVKFAALFILLQFFIGLVLLTSLLLCIVFCTSRSKSKKQSTKVNISVK